MMTFYKYQGAGNDFLIADNRDGKIVVKDGVLYADGHGVPVADICDRRYGVGADGLMLLQEGGPGSGGQMLDFRMVYFNSDGSGGMMCGNGGRCMVAFASDMGIGHFDFEAADGFHTAEIVASEGRSKVVRLKMKDVEEMTFFAALAGVEGPSDGVFLDTGTRHYVRKVEGLDGYDVPGEGRAVRYGAGELQPLGANVNFIEPSDTLVKVRTYEKGVEDETFACGTGIVASCIAAYAWGVEPSSRRGDRVCYDVRAKKDSLQVDFIPSASGCGIAQDVWLTGPAVFVAEILI